MTIRSDATRLRIVTKDKRRSRAVVARQGQALLDTDFDQQSRHQLERIEIETLDSLGSPGKLVVPAGNSGFKVTVGTLAGMPANFDIGAGRGYLDGWLLENPTGCKLGTQPHPRGGDTVGVPAIIGLKALVRHIDPVEDPVLADAALGDAQASGRSLVDWQIFPLAVTGGGTVTCATAASNPDWINLIAPSTGTLAVIAQAAAPSTDPCSLTPGGGYTRLENLLYRFEVHGGDVKPGTPTVEGPRFNLHNLKLKFSRRNASIMVRIAAIAGVEITVAPPALDPRNWFAPGLYAEIVSVHDDVDPSAALANERLFRVALATDDRVVLEANAGQILATKAAGDGNWFLRLWDAFPGGNGLAAVSAAGGAAQSAEIDLGDGLKVKLAGGPAATFRRGDFWTCAARADGSIDWLAPGGVPELMRPHGPEIRYAPIAALGGTATAPAFEDCRIPFATLTDRALLYRGGDGQGVFAPAGSAMVALPGKLRVAVMRGETPVVGATVRWSLFPGAPPCQINASPCTAANSIAVVTGATGLAEVDWAIDSSQPLALHRVQASIDPSPAASGPPPVVFAATFETAAHTGYSPGKCKHLTNVDNVQDALDTLCLKIGDDKSRALNLILIQLLDARGTPTDLIREELILNALEVPHNVFVGGIAFGFDRGKLDIQIKDFDPVVEIELDLPYPITDPDRGFWNKAAEVQGPFAFQRLRLDGKVELIADGGQGGRGGLRWTPSDQAKVFINTAPRHRFGQAPQAKPQFDRILCRIRLRSAMIWVDDREVRERIYLNAEHLGTSGSATGRELLVKDRDLQRAGDLDIFIYLQTPKLG